MIEDLRNKKICISPLRKEGKCNECFIMKNYFRNLKKARPKGIKKCPVAILK